MLYTSKRENAPIMVSLALMLIAMTAVFGQTPAGSFEVSGVVLDPIGAVIPGAALSSRPK